MCEEFVERDISLLDNVKLKGIEELKCGSAFYTQLMLVSGKNYSVLQSCARIIYNSFNKKVAFDLKSVEPNKAFLFSNNYHNRKDHFNWFSEVANLVNNKIVFTPCKSFSLTNINNIRYVFSWLSTVKKIFPFKKAFYFTSILFSFYCDYSFIIKQLNRHKIKLFVSLCDFMPIDSLVTQYCNQKGIKTATLQHGFFSAGFPYSLSFSTFFLGYGEHDVDQAVLSAKPKETVIKVGMPQLLYRNVANSGKINTVKVVGVICNGTTLLNEDIAMINIAIDFAKKYNYKIYVKLHPGSTVEMYPMIEWNNIHRIFFSEINAIDFGKLVEFAIISSSTVFLEFAINLIPFFIYYPCYRKELSREEWCLIHTVDDLSRRVKELLNDSDTYFANMKDSREYYTEIHDVKGNYLNFFSKWEEI